MKTAYARGGGGIESIGIRQTEVPEPATGQALVRLTAATLNYRDLLCLRGQVPGIAEPEYVPLSDGVGEVVAIGEGVRRVKPGDRVSPLFSQGWISGPTPSPDMLGGPVDGIAREYAVFDAESLCLVPNELSDLEAAALPCAGVTAWSALFGARPLKAGEWVCLQGTGGVSVSALQWAKAAGANVVITSSSDAKLDRARALGADITINYRKVPDWAATARELMHGKGADIVVDVVGEAELANCASLVADDGIIAAVGLLQGAPSWGKEVGKPVVPVAVGNREQHEAMLAFCVKHSIRPVVDKVFDLSRLPDALKLQAEGGFVGKIGVNLT